MTITPSICAALVTPVDSMGKIEHLKLSSHTRWILQSGCDGAVLFGTTGESASFGISERIQALDVLLNSGVPAESLIVGTGCCSVADTLRLSQHAIDSGCDGILVHPPFFFHSPDEDGIFAFYSRLIEQLERLKNQIYLYHFPEMTGAPVTPALIERLIKAYPDEIAGVKDSTGSLESMTLMAKQFPQLKVFSGDDHLLWPLLEAGGYGAITATANLTPNLLADVKKGWSLNTQDAQDAQIALTGLWEETLLKFPVSEAVKDIIAMMSGDSQWLNLCPPLKQLPEVQRHQLHSMIHAYSSLFPKGLGTEVEDVIQ
ncbi:dihydrodipicolinate synthase family protein [Aliamphritea ceti]|uniref:dihydrodipicolinate synthase family protein n=1 Tax=Aliamphritea ceti TaxID=1524258 RepID=UPI0021C44C75|nr:dihydrodipicolinate synthase family protein [Aliamphritea ceti]